MPTPTTTRDPKTFDRARLTPQGFIRDPRGDVLIIPDGVLAADVPEWAAFVRESLLPHTRATIRADLKGGYSVYTMFDKDGVWWGPRSVGQQAPSIRLARFHAFQALAQRVLEDDPTNEDAIAHNIVAGRAIARGDRPATFEEVTVDLRLITAAMNTAEAAKKAGEKVSVTADKAAQAGDTIRVKVTNTYRTPFDYDGIRIFNNTGKDIPAGSLISAAGTVPTPAPVPPVEKAPEIAPWAPGDTRLFDRWFAGHPNRGVAAYKDSGEFKNLSAYAYADKWGVCVDNNAPPIEGSAGSFEQNLIAAEKAYRPALAAKQEFRRATGQGNIEAQIVQVGGKRPVGEWYAWIHDTSRRFKVYSADNADELYARADRDGWWVISDHKTLAKGNAGSLEANTRAAERLYQHYAAKKDAEKKAAQAEEPKPPEVATIGMFADRPIGQWFRRTGSGQGISWIFEKTPGEGFSADVSDMSWYVRENGAPVVRGCEGSYEKNLIAADKAYRDLLAAKAAKTPPPAAPAKDRYKVLPSTVDVYTTPTHIAIGQVWRTKDGETAMVSVVTTFEDNYAADANGEVLDIEYDKTGRITDYGGCTYVGYVPVVWLDKVPSGG